MSKGNAQEKKIGYFSWSWNRLSQSIINARMYDPFQHSGDVWNFHHEHGTWNLYSETSHLCPDLAAPHSSLQEIQFDPSFCAMREMKIDFQVNMIIGVVELQVCRPEFPLERSPGALPGPLRPAHHIQGYLGPREGDSRKLTLHSEPQDPWTCGRDSPAHQI